MVKKTVHADYQWVDISKGIAICLMVVGHSSLPSVINRWIFSFHMPFFFFISALLTNYDKYGVWEFFKRKSKALLIPFIIYSVVNIVILPYVLNVSHSEYALMVIKTGWGGIALWFVPVFFLSLMICKLTPPRFLFICALSLLTIGSLFSIFRIDLPWTLSSVPFGAAIMLFTRYFKDTIFQWINQLNDFGWLIVIISGMGVSLFISHFFRLDMACNGITPTVPIMTGIIAGISVCVGAANIMIKWGGKSQSIISSIGRNTYEIMALSQVAIMSTSVFIPDLPVVRYCIMVVVLLVAVYLRKLIESCFTKIAAIL